MKLEVGMYVRTKSFKGFPSKIGKITKIEYNAGIDNETYIALDNDEEKCRRWTEDWLIGKPSFNPVDLIELGDLVKIELEKDNTNVFEVVAIDENNNEIGVFNNNFEFDWAGIEQLKSIVTKEQFESIKYSLEG